MILIKCSGLIKEFVKKMIKMAELLSMAHFNNLILKIWQNYQNKSEITRRFPLLYPEMQRKQVVYIGINPSYSSKINSIANHLGLFKTGEEKDEFFKWRGKIESEKISKIILHDSQCMQHYIYYQPLHKISESINLKMQSIDLFLIRERDQKQIKRLMNLYPTFFKEQILLAYQIVKYLQPKLIIVVNAFASDLIHEHDSWKESLLSYSEKKGYESFLLSSDKIIPIFYSGMLSGGRIDKYNFRRLIWHINRSLKDKTSY